MINQDGIVVYNKDYKEVFNSIPDNSVSLVITDPPYKVTSRGNSGNSGGMLKKKINKQGMVFNHNNVKISDFMPELYRILKDGSHCYIMTNHVNLVEILNVAKECGFHFIKSLIWDKGNKIMGLYYMSQFEYILFFRKGRGKKINNCGTPDILRFPNKKMKGLDGKNLHDTEKPVELMKILVENSTNDENDLVVDPFAGIGSVAIACKQTNRRFLGCEIDKQYFEIAKLRLEGVI